MLTLTELRDANLDALDAAADAWTALSRKAADLSDAAATDLARPLRNSGWDGDAATSAFGRLDKIDDKFEIAGMQHHTVGTLLAGAADQLRQSQKQLQSLLDSAAAQGYTISSDGTVTPPALEGAELHDPDRDTVVRNRNTAARDFAQQITDILTRATNADRQCARALAGTVDVSPGTEAYEYNNATADAQAAAAALGLTDTAIPPAGSDPRSVHDWWARLTADQKHLYATGWPDRIGGLDGVAAVDRDHANQMVLRNYIGDNVNQRNDTDNAQHDRALMLLDKLENNEGDPDSKRLFLLSVDPVGDGRAAVAIGNPDTADRIGVVVPGVGTELDDIRGLLGRAGDIQTQASKIAPGVSVSMIGWLGYDTPDVDSTDLLTAPFGGKSEAGGAALDGFVNGLHAAHDGGSAHITAIGHSYGSTVLGEAASTGDGLNVTDMVAVGSPGMRVENAGEFNVAGQHVWGGAAADDNYVARPENSTFGDFFFGDDIAEIHGPGPHYPEFGGNVLSIDTHGHSGYWDTNSQSLLSQAGIVLGEGYYDRAKLEYGKAPS